MNPRIKDAYPLAPGQEGILFHSLGTPGRGDYVIQIVLDLEGAPDPDRERSSWQALVARHDALRTAFVWQGRSRPLQVVGHRASLEPDVTDLGMLSAAEQSTRLATWLADDRRRGFDLSRAPLLRVTRFALGAARHRVVVTFHHAVVDGWSIPILLHDWTELHAGRDLPPALPFRDHIAWLHAQDAAGAHAYWSDELADLPHDGAALDGPAAPPAVRRGDVSESFTTEKTRALKTSASARGLTLATAVQGAWALVQARASGTGEAVWGLARAGRPAALDGAERRVGMFLNTLPMRARVDPDATLAGWLATVQAHAQAQSPYEHVALSDLQRLSPRPADRPLFDAAVVFENYPTDPTRLGRAPDFTVRSVEVLEQTNLPLTLFATAGETLTLRLLYDAEIVAETTARGILGDLRSVLDHLSTAPDMPLAEIETLTRSAASRPLAMPAPAPDAGLLPALARIWEEVLESPAPEAEDNFFDLGGHSLLALTLQDRIARDLGLAVEIPDLFRFATLGAQSGHLARLRAGGAETGEDRAGARRAGRDRMRRRADTQTRERHENV